MQKPKNGVEARRYRMVALLSDSEREELDKACEAVGVNRSEVIREGAFHFIDSVKKSRK